ncbi:MAG: C39 family peptidase [Verrucomicrobia bacterium]|nr:C39 family peptidase [Verrucomicrobiota bacterium]
MNRVFGLPLWQSDSLWTDNERDAGKRLGWPEESRTATLASYRLYAKDDVSVLGARPYSLALYADKGRVTQVSMVFANTGDRCNPKQFERDTQAIEAALKPLLGEPTQTFFGQTRKIRYKVRRWNWKGHAILLETPENYVGVRVVPAELADREGRAEVIAYQQLRDTLSQRVKRRDNGDVTIAEIPMVNQGPKGYCAPATWERYLRYIGIQADMYVLALAGQTKVGGGTYANLMFENVESLARRNGRRFEQLNLTLTVQNLAKYIDKGFPLMWGIFFDPEMDKAISARSKERLTVTDWKAWLEKLKSARNVSKVGPKMIQMPDSPGSGEVSNGHIRMIVGYNAKTGEVAISDSWGKRFEERWTTVEEARAMTQHETAFWNVRW